MKIGSHVSMSGKEMLLGSVKEALSYGANTFMVYTGAPQNTKRKPVEELNIEKATEYMHQNQINDFIVHAPYIINLANSVNPDIYKLGIDFLAEEIRRTAKMGSNIIVLHPGSHVGAGIDYNLKQMQSAFSPEITLEVCLVCRKVWTKFPSLIIHHWKKSYETTQLPCSIRCSCRKRSVNS